MRIGAQCAYVLALVAGISGCANMGKHPYPNSWPPLKAGEVVGRCPKLDGIYENRAAAVWPAETEGGPNLSDLLGTVGPTTKVDSSATAVPVTRTRQSAGLDSSVTAVRIAQVGETVTISSIAEGAQPVSSLEFHKAHINPLTGFWSGDMNNEYACMPFSHRNASRFLADTTSHSSSMPGYFAGGGTILLLRKAADGSLVAQLHSDSVAMSIIIVGTGVHLDNLWMRYPKVEKGSTASAIEH